MTLLEVAAVRHWYGREHRRPVLNSVNLSVERREVVAVVGESGCGKTTLGRVVAGLLRPSEGTVRYDGRDINLLKGKEAKAWRRSVQLVHQDPYASLNPGLCVASTLGPAVLRHGLATRRRLEEALTAILGQVGLDATSEFLARYPHQLSGGQRQRVAIARAISLRPSLIVADEVTSMLDVSMRVAILDLLLSFRDSGGVAYVFISHDFGVVRYMAAGGRVLVMFYGVLVEEGPTEEVIRNPRHPYTQVLLDALPVPDPVAARAHGQETAVRAARAIEGLPAEVGCVFANRCAFAEDRCREEQPRLRDVGGGHRTACLFPERVPQPSYLRGRSVIGGPAGREDVSDHGAGATTDVVTGPAK